MSIPGYDAWKLATPPEYEQEDETCGMCGGAGILEDECTCMSVVDTCCCLEPEPPTCPECRGRGRLGPDEPDPDRAYEQMRDDAWQLTPYFIDDNDPF